MTRSRRQRRPTEVIRPGRPCPVCLHAQQEAIDVAIARGLETRTELARRYGLEREQLYRHCHGGHLDEALVAHAADAVADAATGLLERVVALCDRLDRRLAARDLDPTAKDADVARLARELRGCLELIAKVSGQLIERVELTDGRGRWADADVVLVLDMLYEAIQEWPEASEAARAAVATALAAQAVG